MHRMRLKYTSLEERVTVFGPLAAHAYGYGYGSSSLRGDRAEGAANGENIAAEDAAKFNEYATGTSAPVGGPVNLQSPARLGRVVPEQVPFLHDPGLANREQVRREQQQGEGEEGVVVVRAAADVQSPTPPPSSLSVATSLLQQLSLTLTTLSQSLPLRTTAARTLPVPATPPVAPAPSEARTSTRTGAVGGPRGAGDRAGEEGEEAEVISGAQGDRDRNRGKNGASAAERNDDQDDDVTQQEVSSQLVPLSVPAYLFELHEVQRDWQEAQRVRCAEDRKLRLDIQGSGHSSGYCGESAMLVDDAGDCGMFLGSGGGGDGLDRHTASTKKISLFIINPQNDFHCVSEENSPWLVEGKHTSDADGAELCSSAAEGVGDRVSSGSSGPLGAPERERGSVAVPNAMADSIRLAGMLDKFGAYISNVYVSLETRPYSHVSQALNWRNKQHQHPAPYTVISHDDVIQRKWIFLGRPKGAVHGELGADSSRHALHAAQVQAHAQAWAAAYTHLLETASANRHSKIANKGTAAINGGSSGGGGNSGGSGSGSGSIPGGVRRQLTIWPEHCIIGTVGHAVVPVLQNALQRWAAQSARPVAYLLHSQHALGENYSAVRVVVEGAKGSSGSAGSGGSSSNSSSYGAGDGFGMITAGLPRSPAAAAAAAAASAVMSPALSLASVLGSGSGRSTRGRQRTRPHPHGHAMYQQVQTELHSELLNKLKISDRVSLLFVLYWVSYF
jgi:uncharacterized membrane protein YgcG